MTIFQAFMSLTIGGLKSGIAATGGNDVFIVDSMKCHIFTGPGTFTITSCPPSARFFFSIVAGGGAGRNGGPQPPAWPNRRLVPTAPVGGGGGGGGIRSGYIYISPGSYPITIGAGGAPFPGTWPPPAQVPMYFGWGGNTTFDLPTPITGTGGLLQSTGGGGWGPGQNKGCGYGIDNDREGGSGTTRTDWPAPVGNDPPTTYPDRFTGPLGPYAGGSQGYPGGSMSSLLPGMSMGRLLGTGGGGAGAAALEFSSSPGQITGQGGNGRLCRIHLPTQYGASGEYTTAPPLYSPPTNPGPPAVYPLGPTPPSYNVQNRYFAGGGAGGWRSPDPTYGGPHDYLPAPPVGGGGGSEGPGPMPPSSRSGQVNTGGGGAGCSYGQFISGAGGPGIVIVAYSIN